MHHTLSKIEPASTAPGAAHDHVYRTLRNSIMQGEIEPGKALTLRGIGKDFGVSMTPAREACRRLVAEGALSLSPSGRVSTPELTNERIEELVTIRGMLETELATRALPRAHAALIERLETINEGMIRCVQSRDPVGYISQNLEFHRTLYRRAQAPAMLALAETVWLQLGPTMRALYTRIWENFSPRHHRGILDSLRAGDEPTLRLAIRQDVNQGLRRLIS